MSWPLHRSVLGLVSLGCVGILVELLLTGHYEGPGQMAALAFSFFLLVLTGAGAFYPNHPILRLLPAGCVVVTMGSVLGVGLHLDSSLSMQLDLHPELAAVDRWLAALRTQSPPALAPFVLALLASLAAVAVVHARGKGASR